MKESLVRKAVGVLRNLKTKYLEDDTKKKPLLEDENTPVFLQITLKKVPKMKSIKMIKVNLPHSLIKETNEVCLITGDLDKRNRKAEIEPDVVHYKDLLNKHGISQINEVMTLRQLRTEYKPFEAKQKLLAAYDIFLADNRIFGCLPKVLGRHFMKKRKFPIQINLTTVNLKAQIDKALSTKVIYFTGHGNCCTSEVAYLNMEDSEIFENVEYMIKVLKEQLPGSEENIMGIYLKMDRSKAIPLYMSYDNPNDVHVEDDEDENDFEIDELSSVPGGVKVKVFSDGTVKVIRAENDTSDLEDNVNGKVGSPESDVLSQSITADDEKTESKPKNSPTSDEMVTEVRKSQRLKRKMISETSSTDVSINDRTIKIQKTAMSKNSNMEEVGAKFIEDTGVLDVSNSESKTSKRVKRKSQVEIIDPDDCDRGETLVTECKDLNRSKPVIELGKDFDVSDSPSIEKKKSKKTKKRLAEITDPDISSSRALDVMKNSKDKDSNVQIHDTKLVEDTGVLDVSNSESKTSKKVKRKSQVVVIDLDDCDRGKTLVTECKDLNNSKPVIEFGKDFDVSDSPSIENKKSKKTKKRLAEITDPDISSSRTLNMMKNSKDNDSNVEIHDTKLVEGRRKRKPLRS